MGGGVAVFEGLDFIKDDEIKGALFQGIPISSSSSRTPVAEAAGSKTQLTGIIGALAVTLLLLVAPNLMQHLPNSALAAVVIAAALGLFEFADLKRIFAEARQAVSRMVI